MNDFRGLARFSVPLNLSGTSSLFNTFAAWEMGVQTGL